MCGTALVSQIGIYLLFFGGFALGCVHSRVNPAVSTLSIVIFFQI